MARRYLEQRTVAGDESVFDELKQPRNWAYMATALQKAASLMDWTRKRDITDWRYIPI